MPSSDSNRDYGIGSRLLHRLALGSARIAKASFEIDTLVERATPDPDARHVFVTGLARAGTTVLLRLLRETGHFHSLSYRNMPFVLMPNLWDRLTSASRQIGAKAERAHADGVLVDYDSPEAFEEVFWRVFCGEEYIRGDRLEAHEAGDEAIEQFRTFVAQVLASGTNTHYLSKNNNNLLRLATLRRAFPHSVIVVPFRNPLQQSASLLRQHRNFVERQHEDPFVQRYMDWLGHHEFGLGHRPFRFGGGSVTGGAERESLDYWLARWCEAYDWCLRDPAAGLRFVSYEKLCRDPRGVIGTILALAELGPGQGEPGTSLHDPAQRDAEPADAELVGEANSIYSRLESLAL